MATRTSGTSILDRSGRPSFVDWQLVQRGPWYLDVGYHIASALTIEDRRRSERDLVAHYLDRLAAGGVEVPPWNDAWLGVRRGFIYGFFPLGYHTEGRPRRDVQTSRASRHRGRRPRCLRSCPLRQRRESMGESIEDRWLRLKPIKVGWLGMEWARFEREITMAFEEGIERGVLDRRYEFLFEEDAGLPQGTAKDGVDAFHRLVDAGCLAVVGANYTDSAMALAEPANAREVPLISMCGTDVFHGEYLLPAGERRRGWGPSSHG